MAKQTGKGRQRRAGALERKATRHQDYIGQAAPERAQAGIQKRERLEAEENREAVREMAAELQSLAAKDAGRKPGAETPLRVPRSLDEAKQVVAEARAAVRGAPDLLREKARQRLGHLREPAGQALHVAAAAASVLLIPARLGLHLAREVILLPFTIASALRDREA